MPGPRTVPFLAALFLVCLSVFGCTPRRLGASEQEFYAGGRADIFLAVSPPLALADSGRFSGRVPADSSLSPFSEFNYAVFAPKGEGTISRHVHVLMGELDNAHWRWEMETWTLPGAFSYAKTRQAGKDWTVQVLITPASTDWFSALWTVNQRSVPEYWLVKRWSATPEPRIRLVAEYREPLPECLLSSLPVPPEGDILPPGPVRNLRHDCTQEIMDFSRRADHVVHLDRLREHAAPSAERLPLRPSMSPDLEKLAGRAEALRGGDRVFAP